MTFELRVPGRVQASQLSCWWACMAMVLEYYGRDYLYPWHFHSAFARPWNRPRGLYPDISMHDADRIFATREPEDLFAPDGSVRGVYEAMYLEPWEWYELGLPPHRGAFDRLSEISGFRGFDERPAFGRWTKEDVESRLRRHGPYVFFGSWNGFPDALVVIGLIDPGLNGEPDVIRIDPINGDPLPERLSAFNRRMVQNMAGWNFDTLNPMYLPQDDPVRGIISHPGSS